ncbi:MAG: enoyl-CoA hydratase/isomerase family protein [Pseudomonadota bacterium]
MTEPLHITDHGDGISVLNLSRAPVNALNPAFMSQIERDLDRLSSDPLVRALVLASPFKVFSAGLDLREMIDYGPEEETAIVDALNRTFLALYEFPKPLVAAVNGAAIAGGLFFALAADHTVAVESSKFGLSEVRVGASFPVSPLEIARAELTPAGLRTLMLRGRPVGAERAMDFGVVDEIVEAEDLLDRATDAAHDLAAAPAATYAAIKRQIRGDTIDRMRLAVAEGSDPTRAGWFTEETRAAMAAVLAR